MTEMQEPRRGCGFRKVHAKYLCGSGLTVKCCGLPLFLKECQRCGYEPAFTRGIQRLNPKYLNDTIEQHECKCVPTCPICYAPQYELYGLMWVGSKYYTPASFSAEARRYGVSKRIADIPKWLVMGETWVLLAHKKVPVLKNGLAVDHKASIFYAFRPERIEYPIWKSEATHRKIRELEKKGYTVVIYKDGDKDHM